MSTKSTIKGKLDFSPRVVFSQPGLAFRFYSVITPLTFLYSDSGEEYSDSLDSVASGAASCRQSANRRVGLILYVQSVVYVGVPCSAYSLADFCKRSCFVALR